MSYYKTANMNDPKPSILFQGTMTAALLEQYRERIQTELDRVVDFWLKYSHDKEHGWNDSHFITWL